MWSHGNLVQGLSGGQYICNQRLEEHMRIVFMSSFKIPTMKVSNSEAFLATIHPRTSRNPNRDQDNSTNNRTTPFQAASNLLEIFRPRMVGVRPNSLFWFILKSRARHEEDD